MSLLIRKYMKQTKNMANIQPFANGQVCITPSDTVRILPPSTDWFKAIEVLPNGNMHLVSVAHRQKPLSEYPNHTKTLTVKLENYVVKYAIYSRPEWDHTLTPNPPYNPHRLALMDNIVVPTEMFQLRQIYSDSLLIIKSHGPREEEDVFSESIETVEMISCWFDYYKKFVNVDCDELDIEYIKTYCANFVEHPSPKIDSCEIL